MFSIVKGLRIRPPKKCKFNHYLLTLRLLESQMRFRSPQNTFGASQQNSVAAFSETAEGDRD